MAGQQHRPDPEQPRRGGLVTPAFGEAAGIGPDDPVAWRYELNGPIPAGLRVRLCSQTRCTELDGASGTTHAFNNVPAVEPLRFIWEVPGGGRLIPALKVQRNEVIVNYR